jgi:hypothetical protein
MWAVQQVFHLSRLGHNTAVIADENGQSILLVWQTILLLAGLHPHQTVQLFVANIGSCLKPPDKHTCTCTRSYVRNWCSTLGRLLRMLSFVSGKSAVGSLGRLLPPGFFGGKWSKGDMMLRCERVKHKDM